MSARCGILQVGDLPMYFELRGQGNPLLLITGLTNEVTQYAPLIADLARDFQVIAFDNRGAGRSGKPDVPYSVQMMAKDTGGLLDSLGISQTHVIGISLGGRIATELALQRPALVRSLVLVSTCLRRLPNLNWRQRVFALMLRFQFFRGREHKQPYYAMVRQRVASRSYDAMDRLGQITVPTLILHGRKDHIAPFEHVAAMHRGIRGSQLITARGGHFAFLFEKELLVNSIRDFLRKVEVN